MNTLDKIRAAMSDTPRTDTLRNEWVDWDISPAIENVFNFARTLERELAEVTRERDRLSAEMQCLREEGKILP